MNFLKQTVTHPKKVGAIAPSSKQLTALMLESAQLQPGQVVVELGPGTGVFTDRILTQLPASSQYIGIEINEAFASHLRKQYPQVDIYNGSAEDISDFLADSEHSTCQRIISGLPWAAFKKTKQQNLLKQLYEALEDDGLFLTFSYAPFHQLPRGRSFRKELEKIFSQVEKTDIVLNLPPAFVYICRK